ncbi:serine hydrolase, partial [Pararhizobium sp.]|uniref:serine hydrolase n=1 Tax=Pararhizobium sp. TaxID=1977563 RepID=UPI003D114349
AAHLPWFQPKTPDGVVADMSVHHLLTHTSGLVYDVTLEHLSDGQAITCGLLDTDLDFEANFSRHHVVPLAFAPGAAWSYSFATDILGAVIAKVHGGSLEDAVVTYIAGPLEMGRQPFSRYRPRTPCRALCRRVPGCGPDDRSLLRARRGRLDARVFAVADFQSQGRFSPAEPAWWERRAISWFSWRHCGPEAVLSCRRKRCILAFPTGLTDWSRILAARSAISVPWSITLPRRARRNRPEPFAGVASTGTNWFIDRANGLTVFNMSNNALEGCMGEFPGRIVEAVYAA